MKTVRTIANRIMRSIALLAWIIAFIIVVFGFLGCCSLLVTSIIGITTGDAENSYKAVFAFLGMSITGFFGTALIRRTIMLAVFSALLNTIFISVLAWIAFGPANGPEGPEAAGRGIAAFFILPFLMVEAGILLNIGVTHLDFK